MANERGRTVRSSSLASGRFRRPPALPRVWSERHAAPRPKVRLPEQTTTARCPPTARREGSDRRMSRVPTCHPDGRAEPPPSRSVGPRARWTPGDAPDERDRAERGGGLREDARLGRAVGEVGEEPQNASASFPAEICRDRATRLRARLAPAPRGVAPPRIAGSTCAARELPTAQYRAPIQAAAPSSQVTSGASRLRPVARVQHLSWSARPAGLPHPSHVRKARPTMPSVLTAIPPASLASRACIAKSSGSVRVDLSKNVPVSNALATTRLISMFAAEFDVDLAVRCRCNPCGFPSQSGRVPSGYGRTRAAQSRFA